MTFYEALRNGNVIQSNSNKQYTVSALQVNWIGQHASSLNSGISKEEIRGEWKVIV